MITLCTINILIIKCCNINILNKCIFHFNSLAIYLEMIGKSLDYLSRGQNTKIVSIIRRSVVLL